MSVAAGDRCHVRVNEELVLDAGRCEQVPGAHGPELLIQPPEITLFQQVLAYLKTRPDPIPQPSRSMAGREGVAAAALTLRWGSYLAVLLDHDKPLWAEVTSENVSRISDEEMARINIEASAARSSSPLRAPAYRPRPLPRRDPRRPPRAGSGASWCGPRA